MYHATGSALAIDSRGPTHPHHVHRQVRERAHDVHVEGQSRGRHRRCYLEGEEEAADARLGRINVSSGGERLLISPPMAVEEG